jgi:hypothetical protein
MAAGPGRVQVIPLSTAMPRLRRPRGLEEDPPARAIPLKNIRHWTEAETRAVRDPVRIVSNITMTAGPTATGSRRPARTTSRSGCLEALDDHVTKRKKEVGDE